MNKYIWIIFVLTGCGTMSKKDCENSDWKHVGFVDGRMGKTADYLGEHRQTCGFEIPDAAAYEEGRQEGVKLYCTPRSAYDEGDRGNQLADVCPLDIAAELHKSYVEGLTTYGLKVEREAVRDEIEKKEEKLANDKSVVADIQKFYYLISGTSATETEQKRVYELSDKINARETLAPAGKPSIPTLRERIETDPFPAARNFLAIATGSVFGFGLGHSIQGTYREQGWKWTAIDVANIAGLAVTSANCTGAEDPDTGQRASKNTGVCALSTLSLVSGLIVSRVWQGIEIGRGAAHTYSPYAVMVEPKPAGGSLVATWTW